MATKFWLMSSILLLQMFSSIVKGQSDICVTKTTIEPTTITTTTTEKTTTMPVTTARMTTTTTTTSTESPPGSKPFVCPSPSTIAPCTCTLVLGDDGVSLLGKIWCEGSTVTQSTIDQTVTALRHSNSLSLPSDWLPLLQFVITATNLVKIDLGAFARTRIDKFYIWNNAALSTLTGQISENEKIDCLNLYIYVSPLLTDSGFGNTLTKFSAKMTTLYLPRNKLQGQLNTEYLPGLSALVNLNVLSLFDNGIRQLGGGQFRTNTKLTSLQLYGNPFSSIGQNAFLFDSPPPPNYAGARLTIDMKGSSLHDNIFDGNNALGSGGRAILADFRGSSISFISEAKFKYFLTAHSSNYLYLAGCPITCDSRMKWLHDGRSLWEVRVPLANCINDQGKTVFTSSLTA